MTTEPRLDPRRNALSPKRFILYRQHDETGVSGTGVVATGVVWPDGHAALRWKADDREAVSSTSVWSSIGDMLRVHGHGGLSKIFYLDADGEEPDAAAPSRAADAHAVAASAETGAPWAWPPSP
jgi:hypothetical protein